MCGSVGHWIRGAGFSALLLWAGAAAGQDAVPADKEAELLLKAISYDRGLEKRAAGGIRIGVVHKDDAKGAEKIAEALRAAGKDKVGGFSVSAAALAFGSVEGLLKELEEKGTNVLYVHPSAIGALSSIQQVTRGRKILSLGGSRQLVEQGLSLGVYLHNEVPRLVVNERAAAVEGLDLAPAIKLISTVVK